MNGEKRRPQQPTPSTSQPTKVASSSVAVGAPDRQQPTSSGDLFADVTPSSRIRELRHGLVAIVITKGEQALIDAGLLPDPLTGATARRSSC